MPEGSAKDNEDACYAGRPFLSHWKFLATKPIYNQPNAYRNEVIPLRVAEQPKKITTPPTHHGNGKSHGRTFGLPDELHLRLLECFHAFFKSKSGSSFQLGGNGPPAPFCWDPMSSSSVTRNTGSTYLDDPIGITMSWWFLQGSQRIFGPISGSIFGAIF